MDEKRKNELQALGQKLRRSVIGMIGVGQTGHLGGSFSLADIVAVLYFDKMNIDAKNPKDPDRDIFLLSKGHAALVQYAALALKSFFADSELDNVKKLGAMLQGHPDKKRTPGVEANTGSLGQGLSIGNGMALAKRLDGAKGRVYVMIGDGEMAEGQVWEAAMASANFKLDNLTAIIDSNKIQATAPITEVMDSGAVAAKWAAFGWNVIEIDGHDCAAIADAIDMAAATKGKPTAIVANTIKGKGVSFAEGKAAYHNGAMTQEQYDDALRQLA